MAKESDQYKEKFRPDADAALDREIDEALGGMSIEELIAAEQPPVGGAGSAGGAGGAGAGGASGAGSAGAGGRGMRRGRVIRVDARKDEVFVDFGGKTQGVAPFSQFEQEPKVGDEMEFSVDRFDPDEGLLILTRKGALASNVSWENLEVGQIVEGTVTGMNKGGLELEVKGMRAFMPAGQVDIYFQKDISTFIGQRLQGEVTQFDRQARNLVLSRRNILEREKQANKQKLLEELEVGQVRRGTVRSIMEFGAFVDLGGVDGLLHVSEMSHRRVKNPGEVVKEGDIVDVKIIKIDKEAGKLSLSLKQAMADPWQHAAERYAVGTVLTARTARVEGFGAFLEVEEGIEGLLPISEMSWQRIRHPSEILKEGDTVKVVVISLDPAAKRMSFSIKQAGGDPWTHLEERYATDMVVPGKVTRTAEFGAFVELEPGLEGLVHISELANQRVRTPSDVVKPNQELRVRILEIDKDRRRIALSLKRAEEVAAPAPSEAAAEAPKKPKKRPQLRGGLDF